MRIDDQNSERRRNNYYSLFRGRERDDRLRERDERDRRIVNRDREDRERQGLPREHEDRVREKDDRDRREKEKERDDRHTRDRREEDRHLDKKEYDKDRCVVLCMTLVLKKNRDMYFISNNYCVTTTCTNIVELI